MPDALTVYLHFPCFDGVISAVLAAEYLDRKSGLKTGEYLPVDYSRRASWLSQTLPKPFAVVDFLYHPEAVFWADHHGTTFVDPEMEKRFHRRHAPNALFDPRAGSCAEIIWRQGWRTLREPRFKEMVEWARRIDSAKYSSVDEAVLGETPALRINLSLLRDSSADYCRFLVETLRRRSLAEVAATPRVSSLYQSVRKAIVNGQERFRKSARMENGVVVFRTREKTARSMVSRYAPYKMFPQALYSVGILENGAGGKILAMRNPWRSFRSVPLGQIFSRHGGGGHQRVAAVLVKDRTEAKQKLGAILDDLRSARSSPSPARQAAAGD